MSRMSDMSIEMSDMPIELFFKIFKYLSPETLSKMGQISGLFQSIVMKYLKISVELCDRPFRQKMISELCKKMCKYDEESDPSAEAYEKLKNVEETDYLDLRLVVKICQLGGGLIFEYGEQPSGLPNLGHGGDEDYYTVCIDDEYVAGSGYDFDEIVHKRLFVCDTNVALVKVDMHNGDYTTEEVNNYSSDNESDNESDESDNESEEEYEEGRFVVLRCTSYAHG